MLCQVHQTMATASLIDDEYFQSPWILGKIYHEIIHINQ
jgi:hypothetical protein